MKLAMPFLLALSVAACGGGSKQSAATPAVPEPNSATAREVPTMGAVRIESVPEGADIIFDGTRLSRKTPYTMTGVDVSKAHDVRIELLEHEPYTETITLHPSGAEYRVLALLERKPGGDATSRH